MFAEFVRGIDARPAVSAEREPDPERRLSRCVASWLDQLSDVRAYTRDEYEKSTVRWIKEWPTIDDVTDRSVAAYTKRRLATVRGKTVRNESSTLRKFLEWAVESGMLEKAPTVPSTKASVTGTPCTVRRRVRAPELSPEEIDRFLAALPEKSATGFWVRDRLVVAFETTLRPATLSKLRSPTNYSRGASTIVLTDSDDKELYGRELPITARARAALDRCLPKEPGPIFGAHKVDQYVREAATATLPAQKATILCAQHMRSAGITRLLEMPGSSLPGVQLLAGHKHASTTDRYVRPSTRAARAVIEAADRILGSPSGDTTANPQKTP